MTEADPTSSAPRQMVLLFTDIADSVAMKKRLGDVAFLNLLTRHNELFQTALDAAPGARIIKHTGDGFLARFETPADGVRAALAFQYALHDEHWPGEAVHIRAALHTGTAIESVDRAGQTDISGLAVDVAARVMSLAAPGQVLLTRQCFDDARQYVREHPACGAERVCPTLEWRAHGPYLFKGNDDDPLEVFEVGALGISPLSPPVDSEKARRAVAAGEEEMYGWRPGKGLEVPRRDGWILERQLGVGGYGEVWLAEHKKTREHRVFKFCFDADRLRSFKRELTLFRLMREALGDRRDIARLHEVNLERPPFYLESEYSPLGDLCTWAEAQGGIAAVPLETRLDLLARAADAVAAAHSIGVLHKDLKPSNILIELAEDGSPRPKITDFGIGVLTDRSQLAGRNITIAGFTVSQLTQNESSRTGTRMYSPPEMLTRLRHEDGRERAAPFTAQGDVYSLGVMLYQMIVGDLDRPLAPGWERDLETAIDDPLRRKIIREDIGCMVDGDPAHRLQTARAVVERLRSIESRVHSAEIEQARRIAEEEAERKQERKRVYRRRSNTFAVIFFCFWGVISYGWWRQSERDSQALERQTELTKEAEQRESEAIAARETALHAAYVANIIAADSALAANEPMRLRARLDACEERLRGWEWEYLDARSDTSLLSLHGHEEELQSASFSLDGTRIVTASWDKTARVWAAATGVQLAVLRGHGREVHSAAFSPDDTRIVTASEDMTARVWDASTGAELATLRGHRSSVASAAFSPDGTRIVTASTDATARVWEASTGAELFVLRGHESTVCSAAFSPDGTRIVTSSSDMTARVWEAWTGAELVVLRGHEYMVYSAAFSPDGTRIVTASGDRTSRVWEAATGAELQVLRVPETSVNSAEFSPDGTRVVTASSDKTARVWEALTGAELAVLRGHEGTVRFAAFSPDGARIVTASSDMTARVWDASTGAECPILRHHEFIVLSAEFSPDGTRIVTASSDKTSRVWDALNGAELAVLRGHEGTVCFAAFSPDGTRIVTASFDKTARVWDALYGAELAVLRGHEAVVRSAAFNPDGTRIVTPSSDTTARVWDARNGAELAVLRGHEAVVRSAAFNRDSTRIVTASEDKTARVWDALNGAELAVLRGHEDSMRSAAFSPDGTRIVTASSDKTARIWDALTGAELAVLRGHGDSITSATFSFDGTQIVTTSRDGKARVWETITGRELALMRGHEAMVQSAAFSLDGSRVVTASLDKTARIWDALTGAELAVLRGHGGSIASATFSFDGTRIITASIDGTARIWDSVPWRVRFEELRARGLKP